MGSSNTDDRRGRAKGHPDEEYRYGPIRIARRGKAIYLSNDSTPSQQAELDRRLASKRPEVVAHIQEHVAAVRAILRRLDLHQVMNRCYIQAAHVRLEKVSESEYSDEENILATHFPEYVQSVIAATPLEPPFEQATEETWQALTDGIVGIYGHEGLHNFFLVDPRARSLEPGFDLDLEAFRVEAAMHFVWVRGNRYPVHDIEFLRDFLLPHTEILQEEFKMSAEQIVNEIQRVQHGHVYGIAEMFEKMRAAHKRFMEFAERTDPDCLEDPIAFMERFFQQEGEEETRQKLSGQFLGTGLFDLGEISDLTDEFLDALSFSPGEDTQFFAPGEKAGWPLRSLPINRRPFLEYEGKYYCFNTHLLFDQLYRAVEQSIRARCPDYDLTWKQRQNEVSERRPREILAGALPDSEHYGSLQYQAPTGKNGKLNWCEVDGVILCHETVFILEIKAGAFTWTSPDDDFEAHLKSIDALLAKPAKQANRLAARLLDVGQVDLCDADRKVVMTLRLSEYPHVIPLCVTLDNLGAWPHQVKELQQVGVEAPPSVCCSIDDLRIYRDAFTSPALLLSYLHLRNEAEHCADAHLNDELDHLGLFLVHGDYVQEIRRQTRELGGAVSIWSGFVEQIDRYFQAKLHGQVTSELSWPYSPMVVQIAEAMLQSGCPGRTSNMLSLLRGSRKGRTRLESRVEKALTMAAVSNAPACVATGMSIGDRPVICVAGAGTGENGRTATVRAAWAFLRRRGERSGWALAVAQEQGRLSAEWLDVSQDRLPEGELALAERAAMEMRETIRHWRGLPEMRNKPCPCGSGRKFKKCCGR